MSKVNKGGRPSKLTKANRELSADWLTEQLVQGEVPTAAGLAVHLGISKATLYVWADKDPEFLDTLSKLQTMQEHRLTSGGLKGEYNATITKLMLANHGYSDKTEQEHSFKFNKDNQTRKYIDAD